MNESSKLTENVLSVLKKLITVRNYAKKTDKSVQWVYELGRRKDIIIVEIDGVKFVKLD